MALPLERLSLIKSRDQVKSDCTGTPSASAVLAASRFFGFLCKFSAKLTVNPANALVIPAMTLISQVVGHLSTTPAWLTFCQLVQFLRQSHDHLFSVLGSDRYNDANSLFDRLVSHSAHVPPLRILPTRVALPLLEFFFDNILECFMFQTQVRIHLFQAPIFFFQFLQPF